ncbi:MAG: vanadium-dependent haloperoxidase [Minicystis sp.]
MPNDQVRANDALKIRTDAAQAEHDLPLPAHPTNGDESAYPSAFANFTKGLPHDDTGEVTPAAYALLRKALDTGLPQDFSAVPLGGGRRFVNPQSGLAFDLEGADSHHLTIAPAPAFKSARAAGEIVENYWMALARDVSFADYGTSPIIAQAAEDFGKLSDFGGQKLPGLAFRGNLSGDLYGPYVSQFLMKDVAFGAVSIDQRMSTVAPGVDYMKDFPTWLAIQRGQEVTGAAHDPVRRFIRNGRDLGEWVHVDALYQAYFHACLILLKSGAPLDKNNPYLGDGAKNQDGFATFGGPHLLSLVTEVATRALKAVWFQKWFVHRRLRPEAFAARVHRNLANGANYPLHADVTGSKAAAEVFSKHGSYLLPMAFPEGSPLHPAYGAGHATVAGACVTILKAWFDESALLEPLVGGPVQASADGLSLVPFTGPGAAELRVGWELNKLASNVAIGRNHAGVHWRSDYTASITLGEQVAISVLRDQKRTYNEPFAGFSLTKFNGETVII